MRELSTTVDLSSAFDHATFEQQIAKLGRKLASLRHGMSLIRAVESMGMHEREREFVKALAKRFHSQGTRTKVIHLPGDVTVTLQHQVSRADLERQMHNVSFDAKQADHLRDEAPAAYKDVGRVMRAQRELTRIMRQLRPVLVYKGN